MLFWTLKLQFFPVAMLAGTADDVRLYFPGKDRAITPGDMHYKLTALEAWVPVNPVRMILRRELEKYGDALPVPLNIYIYAAIEDVRLEEETYGKIGGLFAPGKSVNSIYLVAGAYMINALHHELASILMYHHYAEDREYRRKCRRFLADLRRNGEYNGMRMPIEKLEDHWRHVGATNYAMTDPENDFSMIAEYLFNPRPLQETSGEVPFWVYMDWAKVLEYPVYSKVQSVIELYRVIDPQFTESYFRSLERYPERYMYAGL
jgi:hypothetical protein